MLVFEKYHQKLIIPSNIMELSKVECFLDKLCEDLQINESLYGNIVISVTEAVNNAISHGNKYDENKIVTIESRLNNPCSISIFVKDQGDGFDFNNVSDPTSFENLFSENGRGVFVMKNLADKITYYEKGNIVELEFNL